MTDSNEPYDSISQLFWPVVFILLGAAIGGCLVMLYLSNSIN